jgi:imidazoleglycerol-phosphate dehydratase / histidinol-phosphatase
MRKILFIDRDGTIIAEPADEQIDSFDKFEFLPCVITSLSRIVRELDYDLVMVTNQDGLGTNSYPEESFWPVQNMMLKILKGEGVIFKEILIDRTFEHENAPTRKPQTGLLTNYTNGNVDLENSFVIGDRMTDVQLAKNLGCKAILINTVGSDNVALKTTDWNELYMFLKNLPRLSKIVRRTSETNIEIELNLDGSGKSTIDTGLGFFDHMLEQIARHGNIDLIIKAKGDVEIDEHHTIEDVGISLGSAFLEALGTKKGITRYGFLLPMDDCLAQVAIDFGGRPWLVWDATFTREKIGEMPTEMFMHFFKSFSDSAKCNLNIKAEGTNEHHKIESVFKAFAKAINMAKMKSGNNSIPSTKGNL